MVLGYNSEIIQRVLLLSLCFPHLMTLEEASFVAFSR